MLENGRLLLLSEFRAAGHADWAQTVAWLIILFDILEIPNIKTAQKVPTSFFTFTPLDASGNSVGEDQYLYDTDQLTTSQLNNIQSSQVHIANFRGQIGAKLNLLERQYQNLNERDIAIKKDLTELEDADLAKLVTDLKSQLTGLQASQQAFVKISDLNLFDYLK